MHKFYCLFFFAVLPMLFSLHIAGYWISQSKKLIESLVTKCYEQNFFFSKKLNLKWHLFIAEVFFICHKEKTSFLLFKMLSLLLFFLVLVFTSFFSSFHSFAIRSYSSWPPKNHPETSMSSRSSTTAVLPDEKKLEQHERLYASKTEHLHTNRLIHEKSPYLLQHAHNPVDWYPWVSITKQILNCKLYSNYFRYWNNNNNNSLSLGQRSDWKSKGRK